MIDTLVLLMYANKKKKKWLGADGSHLFPSTQEAEIRRITVQSQPRQIVQETLS
jgi:hypothetical protein